MAVPYIIWNAIFLLFIIWVTRIFWVEYNKAEKKPSKHLFYSILFFSAVTFASVIGLLCMTILQIPSTISKETDEYLKAHNVWHSFFVLFYGKQNCLMLMILYMKLYYAFEKVQSQKLTPCIVKGYMIGFSIALTLFVLVPILHLMDTTITIWTWCASTFCFYNITFMLSLNSLFIYKLWGIHQRSLQNDIFDEEILRMIIKTSLLAFICIAITFTSCIFLILRFSFHIENIYVDTIGNVLISVDIYTNFIFVVMSFKIFEKYYRVFGCLEAVMMDLLSPKENQIVKNMQLAEIDSTTQTSKEESARGSTSNGSVDSAV